MARALALGWGEPVLCTDSGSGRAKELAALVGGEAVASNRDLAERADVVILAHKPAQLQAVAEEIGDAPRVVVSLARHAMPQAAWERWPSGLRELPPRKPPNVILVEVDTRGGKILRQVLRRGRSGNWNRDAGGMPAPRASATCAGVAACFVAISLNIGSVPTRPPFASGAHATNAIPRSSQASRTPLDVRSARLKRFWTATTGTISIARSTCSGVTFERPTCLILPSALSSATAPSDSSKGTSGSTV